MNDTTKPLIALGFVFLVLLALLLVNPDSNNSRVAFADNATAVSDLGLRFSFQR